MTLTTSRARSEAADRSKPGRPAAGRRYVPGLDGLRALAVAAVVAYHLNIPHLGGGLLGVGVFFTLSGYLITDLLLTQWRHTGRLQFGEFWLRRARRLMPGAVAMISTVVVITACTAPDLLARRCWQALAALAYVANWSTIASGMSYFQRFAAPGPLDHLWSLAVEEQFYLIWPPLLLLLLLTLRRNRLRVVAVGALAVMSATLMAVLYTPGFDNTRAYEGTDTRAFGLLVGAALAMLLPALGRAGQPSRHRRWLTDAIGLAALLTIGWMVTSTDEYSPALYRGGLVLLSLAAACLIWAVAHPESRLGATLGWAPLRWIGRRSYGIYLWHLPVIALTGTILGEQAVVRGLLQAGLTVALAAASWRWIEQPILELGMSGALRRLSGAMRFVRRRAVVASTVALVLVGATACAASHRSDTSGGAASGGAALSVLRTSCQAVIHVGDSTSEGLISPDVLPNPADRIDAQYRDVGVTNVSTEIAGARSIVETVGDVPNAQDVVRKHMDEGYKGCWVIAMGTNEAANQAVGGVYPLDKRIDLLMKIIGDHPVMWLTVRTLLTHGPYADSEMQKMNTALTGACTRYPNMRVYDWAKQVQDSWFGSDQIHFTSKGYQERAERTAQALATAFPAGKPPAPGCLVS